MLHQRRHHQSQPKRARHVEQAAPQFLDASGLAAGRTSAMCSGQAAKQKTWKTAGVKTALYRPHFWRLPDRPVQSRGTTACSRINAEQHARQAQSGSARPTAWSPARTACATRPAEEGSSPPASISAQAASSRSQAPCAHRRLLVAARLRPAPVEPRIARKNSLLGSITITSPLLREAGDRPRGCGRTERTAGRARRLGIDRLGIALALTFCVPVGLRRRSPGAGGRHRHGSSRPRRRRWSAAGWRPVGARAHAAVDRPVML